MTCEVLWVNYVIPHLLGMSWNTMWPTIFWCANSTCSGLIDENIARYYLFSPSSIQLPIYFPKISPLFFVLCVLPSTTDWDRVRSACMVRANIIKDISRQRYNWMWTCEGGWCFILHNVEPKSLSVSLDQLYTYKQTVFKYDCSLFWQRLWLNII